MAWYLGYVHSGKSNVVDDGVNGPTVRREFNEFVVEQELRKLGIECWCGRKIEFLRTGKNRRPEPHEGPYLRNYIFMNIPAEDFSAVTRIKKLSPTLMVMTQKEVDGIPKREGHPAVPGLRQFREAVEEEYAAACRVRDNQEMVAEYKAGQALRYLDQGLEDTIFRFKRMVERAGDLYPKVVAEVEMMGRVVDIELDPLSVRALG